jgi:hypothetical protein
MESRYDLLQSETSRRYSYDKEVTGENMYASGVAKPLQACPSDRVQKLLNCSQYEDVLKKVDVEGLFLQLNEDGSPLRQVFLAMTQKEVLIVEQVISFFLHFSFFFF